MYCGHCGSELAEQHRFCTSCGQFIGTPETSSIELASGKASIAGGNPLDPAVIAFNDGHLSDALQLIRQVGYAAEAANDELQLVQTLEVLEQMTELLDRIERQPFAALAETTEQRILRVRDAALPPRLAEAWRAFEAVDFDWTLELLRAEINEAGSDRESVERVRAVAREMTELVNSGYDQARFERFASEQ